MTRRESRQEAFYLMFEKTFTDQTIDEIIKYATETRDLEVSPFTKQLAEGISEHQEEIDQIINSKLKKWKLSRISRVSLAVLRTAVYEMCYISNIPVSVSINEAVELAKIYSGKEDGAFVNGVLSSVAKDIQSSKNPSNVELEQALDIDIEDVLPKEEQEDL